MERREFISLIGGAAAMVPLIAQRAAGSGAGHCAALVAIDRNIWSRFIGEWSRLSECTTF